MKKAINCNGTPLNVIEEEVCGLYKGNLRLAVLRCLKEGSKETETIVERLTELTDGEWSPNPSSVEEVLNDFKNFGLVISKRSEGAERYQFTEKGRDAYSLIYERINNHIGFLDWILEGETD